MKKILGMIALTYVMTIPTLADIKYEDLKWEIGTGGNYGGFLGGTANAKVGKKFEVFGGVALLGAVAGARYYFTPHVRANLNYGVQGYLLKEYKSTGKEIDIIHGVNLGVDYVFNKGFNLGIVYHIVTNAESVVDDAIAEGFIVNDNKGRIKLSLGYRF